MFGFVCYVLCALGVAFVLLPFRYSMSLPSVSLAALFGAVLLLFSYEANLVLLYFEFVTTFLCIEMRHNFFEGYILFERYSLHTVSEN